MNFVGGLIQGRVIFKHEDSVVTKIARANSVWHYLKIKVIDWLPEKIFSKFPALP